MVGAEGSWCDPLSRRRFFRVSSLSLAGGGAVFLSACGGDSKDANTDTTTTGNGSSAVGDIAILNAALDLEYEAVAAYTAAAPLLEGRVLEVARLFSEQEREHADGLAEAIKQLGGTANQAKPAEEYGFPKLASEEDVLNFALGLENNAVAAYIDALPKLSSPDLRGTAASIVTNEAEHISVLLGALGKPQVPDAFVVGRKSG